MPTREECIDEFARWLAGVLVAREADQAAALMTLGRDHDHRQLVGAGR